MNVQDIKKRLSPCSVKKTKTKQNTGVNSVILLNQETQEKVGRRNRKVTKERVGCQGLIRDTDK